MKLARIGAAGCEVPVVQDGDGGWRSLRPVTEDIDGAFLSRGLADVRAALTDGRLGDVVEPGRFGPPVARPGKIVCIGLNYRDHAAETRAEIPAEPVVFLKTAQTMVGAQDTVLIPRRSTRTDWEVELAVVIGAEARYLDCPADSARCITGYAISNDVSEREFQKDRGGTWDKGKNCDTFNPMGPWLVSADSVPDPQALRLRLSVNGERRQDGTTSDMIFAVDHLIWYVSQFMVLEPGDVINTGTPAGVAMGMPDQPYLRAGDVVELEIDGLGRQRQQIGQA